MGEVFSMHYCWMLTSRPCNLIHPCSAPLCAQLANEFIAQMVTAAQVAAAEEARLEEEKLKAEWEEMVRQEEERIAKIEEVWLAEYEELKKEAEATLSGEALETYLKEKKQKEEIR